MNFVQTVNDLFTNFSIQTPVCAHAVYAIDLALAGPAECHTMEKKYNANIVVMFSLIWTAIKHIDKLAPRVADQSVNRGIYAMDVIVW